VGRILPVDIEGADGLIDAGAVTGGTLSPDRVIQAALVNQGTLYIGYDTTSDRASSTLTQSSGTSTILAHLDMTGSAGTFTVNGGTFTGFATLTGDLVNNSGTVSPSDTPGLPGVLVVDDQVHRDHRQRGCPRLVIDQAGDRHIGQRFRSSGRAQGDSRPRLSRD
jgi:hypothetical protein